MLGAEHRERTDVHRAGHTCFDRRREQTACAVDVDALSLATVEPLADEAGGVEDALDSVDGSAQSSRVREITLDELDAEYTKALGAGGIADERAHAVTALDERACKAVPDEAGAAGDEHCPRVRHAHGGLETARAMPSRAA